MLYSVDGRIVEVGGKFPERRVNSLTFQTRQSAFPVESGQGFSYIKFISNTDQSFLINYGDGTVKVKETVNKVFGISSGTSEADPSYLPQHIFTDIENNGSLRSITIEFENLLEINHFDIVNVLLSGNFPVELELMQNINYLRASNTLNLTSFADPSKLVNLKRLNLSNIFEGYAKLHTIQDGFFNTKIWDFGVAGVYDLSNPTSSNFYKINQLSSTLTILNLQRCNIGALPKSLSECVLLTDLRLTTFNAENSILNPEVLESLLNLSRFYVKIDPSVNYLFNTTKMTNLTSFLILDLTINQIHDIPNKWTGLKALKAFMFFDRMILNNLLFDEFIDNFYILCTTNGFLDPTTQTAIDTGFPNQFRDFSWGASSLTQTGEIQAPASFVLGSNNGTPANQGEKIYVLVNNYGHNVTTSGNFN